MKPGVYISIKLTGDADSAWLGAIGLIQVHHYTVYIYFLSRFFFFFGCTWGMWKFQASDQARPTQ